MISMAFIAAACLCPAQAQLTVSNLLQYQVIQRDSTSSTATYTATGTCRSGTDTILFNLTSQTAGTAISPFSWVAVPTSVSGTTWSATLSGLPVGGEYGAQFKAVNGSGTVTDSTAVVPHILVGDIWLVCGQSNLQVAGSSTTNPNPTHLHIRQIFYEGNPGAVPYTRADTSHWGVGTTNGPSMAFGNKIFTVTGVPIGIVEGSAGGSSLNEWDTSFFLDVKKFMPTVCNWKIAGFLWYQGEAEDPDDSALVFQTKFDTVILKPLRTLTNNPRLPVCDVQLESWSGTGTFAVSATRQMHWVIIRDRQELVGRTDAYTGTAPIWDAAGLHISQASQAILGPRCAARMINVHYSNLAPYQPSGPLFKQAWFLDSARSQVVVQFENVTGRITNPADPNHLGFYVMKPNAFNNNDSLAFAYDDTEGRTPPMLLKLSSVDTLGTDKVVITLTTPVPDSLTVGYGSTWNYYSANTAPPLRLTAVSDSSGIPLCTFYNRPILPFGAAGVKTLGSAVVPEFMSIHGSTLQLNTGSRTPVSVSICNINGRLARKFSMMSRSVDLRQGLGKGSYLVIAEMGGRRVTGKVVVF